MWTRFMIKTIKTSLFVLLLLATICFVSSCEKVTPGSYTAPKEPEKDTTTWLWQYSDAGVLPSWGTPTSNNNELFGTKWVVTKVVAGYSTSYPNDTLTFVSNTEYKCNSGANRPYTLSSGVASTNKTLTLYYCLPFGGSHYSGEVGYYFVSDGQINNVEFTNIQNTTSTIKAWLVKL